MSEGINGDQRKIFLGFPKMMEWMGELDTVGGQEVDLLSLRHQFTFHKVIVLLSRSLYRSNNEVK